MDIDPRNAPDYVASICDMSGVIEDGSFDAIWSSHCIEHLHDHEVLPALREFKRILKEDGFAIVACPKDIRHINRCGWRLLAGGWCSSIQDGTGHLECRAPSSGHR